MHRKLVPTERSICTRPYLFNARARARNDVRMCLPAIIIYIYGEITAWRGNLTESEGVEETRLMRVCPDYHPRGE